MPNRLMNETSPYLLQHAHNPVDWYPWGDEALKRAKEEDKPIFLSIGYSACHWCHVMEHESFEDPEVAAIMNQFFVNIKVDREERPDIDAIYMEAVQAMTGHGGWPLTVFLTPDGKPFYGGTYFPPEDSHGVPSFKKVLLALAELYETRRGEVVRASSRLVEHLNQGVLGQQKQEPITSQVLNDAYKGLVSQFDSQYGGFGSAPKFPQPMALEFLLRHNYRTKDAQALQMVGLSLEAMARGGIYDHLGGGFHRYSTDPFWLVPHFEKMLYDNALLSALYLHAYQVAAKPLYRRICEETLDYVLREMTNPEGGFYSTQDADSEGEEGKFYLWTFREIDGVLDPEEGALFRRYFGVTEEGNFEGRNILYVGTVAEGFAQEAGMTQERLDVKLKEWKKSLLEARSKRVPPAKDDKVLTSWNGLMLKSLAQAASALGKEDYSKAAIANANFLLSKMRQDGRLLRIYRQGEARVKGYLEDYSFLADGLLALYEATFDSRWLKEARSLADQMIDLFYEPFQSAFYDTGKDHEALVMRPRGIFDNATPSGGSVAADVLLRLATLTGEGNYSSTAAAALRSVRELMAKAPTAFGQWLSALGYYLSTPKEIAIVGKRDDPATQALLWIAHSRYLPNRVIAGRDPQDSDGADGIVILQDRGLVDDKPTAYVCENHTCQLPVTTPEALAQQLAG